MATQHTIEKSLQTLKIAGISFKGSSEINEEMVAVYMTALEKVNDEQLKQATKKIISSGLDDDVKALSAPALRKICMTLSGNAANTAYTPLPENRQIEDPSQQPITAAEWRRRRAGEEPKCWKGEDGYMRANPAWMLQQIQKGKAKFSQNAASLEQIARDMGLIAEQPKSRSFDEAMQILQNRPPEVQDKIKQLAEINKKIEMAEAWLESNQNLSHEVAKKAEERYSKLFAESLKLSEELEILGVCA